MMFNIDHAWEDVSAGSIYCFRCLRHILFTHAETNDLPAIYRDPLWHLMARSNYRPTLDQHVYSFHFSILIRTDVPPCSVGWRSDLRTTSYYIRAFDNQADRHTEIFLENLMLSHKILNNNDQSALTEYSDFGSKLSGEQGDMGRDVVSD